MKYTLVATVAAIGLLAGTAHAGAMEDLLARYKSEGAGEFSAERGAAMWTQLARDPESGKEISCATCHMQDLRKPGKHEKTGKLIEPLAPSANPKRLTDVAHIEKWFTRNCKGTWGRLCTPQEKGDFLMFMSKQ